MRKKESGKRNQETQWASDSKSDSCSTRPVTPTGLAVPVITSRSRTDYEGLRQPPTHPEEKRLKDVGVMCPSPYADTEKPTQSRRKKPSKELTQKQHNEEQPDKGILYGGPL